MNDSNVSFATFASFKGLTKRFPRDAAYLLFYRKQQVSKDDPAASFSKLVRLPEGFSLP